MNKIQLLFLFALVSFEISGCNYYVNKVPAGAPSTKTAGVVDFQRVNRQVLQPKCGTCHGATMTQFDGVQTHLSRILDMIETRRMPPGGGLPQDEIDLIRQWVADGAPENVSEGLKNEQIQLLQDWIEKGAPE